MIWFARVLSFSVGFLSLSQEILWVRLIGFVTGGLPHAFAFVLGSFLVGIALGARLGKRFCEHSPNLVRTAGVVLVVAGLIDLALPWLALQAIQLTPLLRLAALGFLIALSACLKSVIFPIAHHLGTVVSGSGVGISVSRVYFANILGSTFGPLVTGLILLQHFPLRETFAVVGLATVLAGLSCLARAWPVWKVAATSIPAILGVVLSLKVSLVEEIILVSDSRHKEPVNFVLENRHGILHTRAATDDGGDWVYGGNVYDGRANTNLLIDSNGISRVYVLAALHPAPRKILEIGVGSGSWLAVLASFPDVESLDVVEINPGYGSLMQRFPEVQTALEQPSVHLRWTDGRKWLREHPENRFDLIVANTTFHWRSYSTMLLSRDFMLLAKSRLSPGGIYAFNSTRSEDAFVTAQSAFKYVYRFGDGFAIASDSKLQLDLPTARQRLQGLRVHGYGLLDVADPKVEAKIDDMVRKLQPFVPISHGERPAAVITDQNMLTEYRHGTRLWWWR